MKRTTPTIKPYISKRSKKTNKEADDSQKSSNIGVEQIDCGSSKDVISCSQTPNVSLVNTNGRNETPQTSEKPEICKTPNKEIVRVREHSKAITTLQWHPININTLVSTSLDKKVLLWNYGNHRYNNHSNDHLTVKRILNVHSEGVKAARWSSDGSSLLTASFDKTCKITDIETGTTKVTFPHSDLVTAAIFHCSNDQLLISGTFSNGIFSWDMRQSKPTHHFKKLPGQVQDLIFLPDNETFLSSAEVVNRNSLDKTIVAWDFKTTAVMSNQIYQEPFTCTCMRLAPSKRSFLVQSAGGYVVIFNAEKPWKMNKYKRYEGHQASGYYIGFDLTADGSQLISGDVAGCFFAYNYHTSRVLKEQKLFTDPCVAVSFNPQTSSTVCFGSWNGEMCLWR